VTRLQRVAERLRLDHLHRLGLQPGQYVPWIRLPDGPERRRWLDEAANSQDVRHG
jgi:hypothetical protein